LNSRGVDYLVIGGVATIAHGVPRLTLDLDLMIRPTRANAVALLAAFEEAGLGTALLTTPERLLANEITIFKDRIRVDVQTATPGLDFEAAHSRRRMMDIGGAEMPVVALDDLIASKRASGRPRDLEDVVALEALRGTEA
jgi:predicted nucleotidyltransferase